MSKVLTVMIRWTLSILMTCVAALVLTTQLAWAETKAKPEGSFGDWSAYSYKNAKGTVCYVVSQPKSSEPKGAKRDPIYFLVTHRPGEKVRNEVNTIIGYPFKKGSLVTMTIDGNKYQLFTSGDGAWAESSTSDKKIVAAMKAGKKMSVSGTSWRGTNTVDHYSLSGVTAAMDKINALCK